MPNIEKKELNKIKVLHSLLNNNTSELFVALGQIKETKANVDAVLNSYNVALEKVKKSQAEEEAKAAFSQEVKAIPVEPVVVVDSPKPQTISEPQKEKEKEKPKDTAKPVAFEKVEKPAEPAKSAVPSWVKRTYIPTPPPQPTARPMDRPQYSSNRPPYNAGGAPRPPYNNSARPPYNNNGQAGGYNNNQSGGFNRPNTGFAPRPPMAGRPPMKSSTLPKIDSALSLTKDRSKVFDKKKEFTKPLGDDKKGMNKRTLIRKGFIQDNLEEDRMGTRKLRPKKAREIVKAAPIKIEKAVITTENLTVKILSEKIGKTAQEIIKQLMVLGIMTTINSVVDFPTMELVASELGVELELRLDKTKEEVLEGLHDLKNDTEEELVKRPPIITVMGHVDHGKTSLLDAIKKTNVAIGEAGGITQHIGAYSVVLKNEKITFLDTPGHEAFAEMRARGAKVTDIAIIVVAADDGIMPQTIEAIKHAKDANVPIIVAINKIDKPGANIERIKEALTEYGLVTEEWGGDTIMVPISAKQGTNIDKLLESILLLAEVNNYRANPNRGAQGTIIEAKLDKGKGPVATIIVQNGTLHVGDIVVSGTTYGRIRAMSDDKSRNVKEADPSMAVSVLGFNDVPNAGDKIYVVEDEKLAKQVVSERNVKERNELISTGQISTLDEVFSKCTEDSIKELNVVLKADTQGSAQAIKSSVIKLSTDKVKVNVVHSAVGAINESDLMLAEVSKAIIIGFNVRPDADTKMLADQNGTDIRLYKIIYEALEDVQKLMNGLLEPVYKEEIVGKAEVRSAFKVTGVGLVAGSYVTSGKILRSAKARVIRDGAVIYDGKIGSLKRFKDDVKEVAREFECGINIENYSDIKEGDIIEAYILTVVEN